jgi:hypothetical protein
VLKERTGRAAARPTGAFQQKSGTQAERGVPPAAGPAEVAAPLKLAVAKSSSFRSSKLHARRGRSGRQATVGPAHRPAQRMSQAETQASLACALPPLRAHLGRPVPPLEWPLRAEKVEEELPPLQVAPNRWRLEGLCGRAGPDPAAPTAGAAAASAAVAGWAAPAGPLNAPRMGANSLEAARRPPRLTEAPAAGPLKLRW